MGSVKDIRAMGGKVPTGRVEIEQALLRSGQDEGDDIVNFMFKLNKAKMMKEALSPSPPPPQPASTKSEEKTTVDLGTAFTAMTNMMTTQNNQLLQMMQSNQAASTNPVLLQLQRDFDEMKRQLSQPGQDPIDAFVSGMQKWDGMAQFLKKSLGVPQQTPVGTTDIGVMMQLEQMKIEAADRRMQHDREMQQLKWQHEDTVKLADRQYSLEVVKLSDERKGKQRTGEMLEDLLGSLVDGLNFSPQERQILGIEATGQPDSRQQEIPPPKPIGFKCSCGATVRLKDPADLEAVCPGCGTVFDLRPYQQPESSSPAPDAPAGGPPPSGVMTQEQRMEDDGERA